jgi:hypothetical protein
MGGSEVSGGVVLQGRLMDALLTVLLVESLRGGASVKSLGAWPGNVD